MRSSGRICGSICAARQEAPEVRLQFIHARIGHVIFLQKEDAVGEIRVVFWVTVALTVLSGAGSIALAARRNASAASYRVADRLAQIAVVGASAIIVLLGQS